jgi:hypothetical protein
VPGDSSNSSKGSSSSEPVVFSPLEQRIGGICKTLTTLFPLWVVAAALLGFHHPPLFLWFNDTYVTWSLIFCMLAMVRGGSVKGSVHASSSSSSSNASGVSVAARAGHGGHGEGGPSNRGIL